MPMKTYEASLTGAQSNAVLLMVDSQDNNRGETFSSLSVQVNSNGTGATLNYEQSNDGVTWYALPLWDTVAVTSAVVVSTNTVGMRATQWYSRFARLRITGQTAGTTSVVVIASDAEFAAQNTQVGGAVSINGTVPSGATVGAVGNSVTRVKSAATTNATLVKSSAGNLYGIHVANPTAAAKFLKFYNKATAPVPGTDTPLFTIPIPAGQRVDIEFTVPLRFVTGIGFGITGAIADTDTTVTAVDDVTGALLWA